MCKKCSISAYSCFIHLIIHSGNTTAKPNIPPPRKPSVVTATCTRVVSEDDQELCRVAEEAEQGFAPSDDQQPSKMLADKGTQTLTSKLTQTPGEQVSATTAIEPTVRQNG